MRVVGELREAELAVALLHHVERMLVRRRLRIAEERGLRAVRRGDVGAARVVVAGHVDLVHAERVGEIAHPRRRVLRVAALRKLADELLERGERFAHLLRIALGEVELVHVAEQPLVLPEIDEALQVVRVVDVRVIRIGADEAVAGRRRVRLLAEAPVRERAFEDRLLREPAVRIAGFQRLEQLDRPRIIPFEHRLVGVLVQLLGIPSGRFFLDVGQQSASRRRQRRQRNQQPPLPFRPLRHRHRHPS